MKLHSTPPSHHRPVGILHLRKPVSYLSKLSKNKSDFVKKMQHPISKGSSNSEEHLPSLESNGSQNFDSSRCRSASPNLIHLAADAAIDGQKSSKRANPTNTIPILQRKTPSMLRLDSYRSYLDRKTEALWRCIHDNDDTSGESSDPSEAGRRRSPSDDNCFEFIDLDEVSSTSSGEDQTGDCDDGSLFRMDP